MKYLQLDPFEKDLLDEYEKGDFESVPDLEAEKERYRKYAQEASNKTRNINIRISEGDLIKLKARAFESGIPYQTLLSSLIRQFNQRKISFKL